MPFRCPCPGASRATIRLLALLCSTSQYCWQCGQWTLTGSQQVFRQKYMVCVGKYMEWASDHLNGIPVDCFDIGAGQIGPQPLVVIRVWVDPWLFGCCSHFCGRTMVFPFHHHQLGSNYFFVPMLSALPKTINSQTFTTHNFHKEWQPYEQWTRLSAS